MANLYTYDGSAWVEIAKNGEAGPAGGAGPQGNPGNPGTDGREIQLDKTSTTLRWRYVGSTTWTHLVALADITGPAGAAGVNGKNVELAKSATHLQWRLVGDATWLDLVPLADITGPIGPQGPPGTTDPALITQTATYRFVSDTEKSTWNGKQANLGFTPLNVANNLSEINTAGVTARSNARSNIAAAESGTNISITQLNGANVIRQIMGSPSSPNSSASTTGGTLATGTYFYRVTALDGAGNETNGSSEISRAVTGPTGSVTVTWASRIGASAYRIYRATSAGSYTGYIGQVSNVTSFVDTGQAITAATMPGNSNANIVEITASTGVLGTSGIIMNAVGTLQTRGAGTGTVIGGARGTGALDLQVQRTAATQVASGAGSIVLGSSNEASGVDSCAIGTANIASGIETTAIGYQSRASLFGQFSMANGCFDSAIGSAQQSNLTIRCITTDATATELTLDGTGTGNRLVMPNDTTWIVHAFIIGRRTDLDGFSACWEYKGVIRRNVNASETGLLSTTTPTAMNTTMPANYALAVTADATNGSIKFTATGVAGHTIRWVARVMLTEVTG